MAKMVLVWHDVVGPDHFVEIDERHLAHPILGPHYHIARLSEDGKPIKPNAKEVKAAKGDSDEADK